jgi:hypothetical protein
VRIVGVGTVQTELSFVAAPATAAFPEIPTINPTRPTPPPPVESGELRVSARVQVVFQLE